MNPPLRAISGNGWSVEDPSEDALFELLLMIEDGTAEYLIVERADPTGQTYIQTRRLDDGRYVVERREGSAEEHFATLVADMRDAHALIAQWAFRLDGREAVDHWSRLHLPD